MIIISPAKTLDWTTPIPKGINNSSTRFDTHTQELIHILKKFSSEKIATFMNISEKLAQKNYDRYQNWQELPVRPAIYSFKGDVYNSFDINNSTLKTINKAQEKLRILSGLYGLIRPLDGIKPYRLEMGKNLEVHEYKNLYQFWSTKITKLLQKDIKDSNSKLLINLASNEYSKVIQLNNLGVDVVTPIFQDFKKDQYKIISFFAKKARGAMARFIIDNDIQTIDHLKNFSWEGYKFDQINSSSNIVFKRKQ